MTFHSLGVHLQRKLMTDSWQVVLMVVSVPDGQTGGGGTVSQLPHSGLSCLVALSFFMKRSHFGGREVFAATTSVI